MFLHTHTRACVCVHAYARMHTEILQHKKHRLAFIFCQKYFISKFLDHEFLKWKNLEHSRYIEFKSYDLQKG